MQDFLLTLVMSSFTMSLIALLFIFLTPQLAKKYTAKWLYYTWLLIIIGFIIPYRPQFNTAFIKVTSPPVSSAFTLDAPSTSAEIVTTTDTIISTPSQTTKTSNTNWYQVISYIWLVGFWGTIIYHILRHIHFLKIVKRWSEDVKNPQLVNTLQDLQIAMNISSPLTLKLCPCITSPMLVGFLKPLILLPTIAYEANELSLILKHELIHFKRKDLWYKALVLIATALHWFNPVIYIIAQAVATQCELSCDEEVVFNADIKTRQRYGETILCTVRKQNKFQTTLSTNFYGGKKGMKNRIFSIMDARKKKKGVTFLCLILSATLISGLVFAADNGNNATMVLPGITIIQDTCIESVTDKDMENLLGKNYKNMTVEEYEKKIAEIYGHPENEWAEENADGTTSTYYISSFDESKISMGRGITFDIKDKNNLEHVIMVGVSYNYHIKDKSKITIQERENLLTEYFNSLKKIITTIPFEQLTKQDIVQTLQVKYNKMSESTSNNNLTINAEIDQYSVDDKVIYKKEYPQELTPQERAETKGMQYYKVDKTSEEITDKVITQIYKELGIPRTSSVMLELKDGSILSFIPEDPFSISALNGLDTCKFYVKAYAQNAILDKIDYHDLSPEKANKVIMDVLKKKVYTDPQQLKSDVKLALGQEFGIDKDYFVVEAREH